jgi:hypothetical protein
MRPLSRPEKVILGLMVFYLMYNFEGRVTSWETVVSDLHRIGNLILVLFYYFFIYFVTVFAISAVIIPLAWYLSSRRDRGPQVTVAPHDPEREADDR